MVPCFQITISQKKNPLALRARIIKIVLEGEGVEIIITVSKKTASNASFVSHYYRDKN